VGRIRIATAGWSVPREIADRFPAEGSALQRYAGRFDAAEINSTFHRSHRAATYARWRATTPPDFRFAVKLWRGITHDARLAVVGPQLDAAIAEASLLEEKLGPILVQLPPSLAFDAAVAGRFFAALRDRFDGAVVCEPRHASWFGAAADDLLCGWRVARVAADPARHALAATPGGWPELAYWRLHGSPRMYFSAYGEADLAALAGQLAASPAAQVWCVFDNTASGAAAQDALRLQALLKVAFRPSHGRA